MTPFGDEPVILDGGLATELEARGCDISGALWSARYQASCEGFATLGIDADGTTGLLQHSVELAHNARTRGRRQPLIDQEGLALRDTSSPAIRQPTRPPTN